MHASCFPFHRPFVAYVESNAMAVAKLGNATRVQACDEDSELHQDRKYPACVFSPIIMPVLSLANGKGAKSCKTVVIWTSAPCCGAIALLVSGYEMRQRTDASMRKTFRCIFANVI